jgi:hypothetical protein
LNSAGRPHAKKKKKQPKNFSCIAHKKTPSSSRLYTKEKERNGQDYQKYALFVPFLQLFLSLSLSLLFPRGSFFVF